jgi:hypothetical protein
MTEPIDAVLARLVWTEGCAETRVELRPGVWIDLLVWYDEPDRTQAERLQCARSWLTALDAKEEAYRRWSADQMAGDNWSDPPLTADEIFALLTVASLNVFDDGRADVYWNDQDELYWGHNVVTRLGRKGECIEVAMEG